jgi:S1-C subfamily serine protease
MDNLYDLSKQFEPKKTKKPLAKWVVVFIISAIFISSISGFFAGLLSNIYFSQNQGSFEKLISKIEQELGVKKTPGTEEYVPQTSQEEKIIGVVKDFSPAVVSIVISKDVPIIEKYYYNPFEGMGPVPFEFNIPQYIQKGTEKKEIGGGTGFIVSQDGLILTNKHVVLDDNAEYTVFTNDGKKFPAKVLAKDPVQDLALIKIDVAGKSFPIVKLGDSDNLQIGQSVIAIGNALGEFRNTVSVGVISGLSRSITASGGSFSESLEDIIQTDAAINPGNSGGPLLNLKGEVIGINTAIATGAQSISFSIPINKAKKDIEQVGKIGKIVYPFLGIRYVIVNEEVKSKYNLSVDYGALISKGDSAEPAITAGSAAQKAGLKEGDVILEFNGEKITQDNSLAKIIAKYNPGDKAILKVLRNSKEMNIELILGEWSE